MTQRRGNKRERGMGWRETACWGATLFCILPVLAGESPPTAEQRLKFSEKVVKVLQAKGAQVALLARMGRPAAQMPKGMHFTHVGFAVANPAPPGNDQGVPGYTTYNMYQDEKRPDASRLVEDPPAAFFAKVAELEAGIVFLSSELQRRLLAVIHSPTYRALHDPRYSLIANPYTLGKQNCTEFVLDVLQAAIHQTDAIQQIKAYEKAHFVAQEIHVPPLKLRLAALFSAEVALSDQSDPPVTATFETIAAFLQQYDTGAERVTLQAE
ncbi:MAG: DUF2145 domain-containing protein [Magnetococcus sp. YQC-3]